MDTRKKRNKFDIDEDLESPFDIRHLKRSMFYIRKHSKSLLFGLFLSVLSTLLSLITPQFSKWVIDDLRQHQKSGWQHLWQSTQYDQRHAARHHDNNASRY